MKATQDLLLGDSRVVVDARMPAVEPSQLTVTLVEKDDGGPGLVVMLDAQAGKLNVSIYYVVSEIKDLVEFVSR